MAEDPFPVLVKTVTADQINRFEQCAADLIGRPAAPTIHTDAALAGAAGFRGPLAASGMLSVAFLNEYLLARFGPDWHRHGHLAVAFVAPTRAGEIVTVDAAITDRQPVGGGEVISLEVWCANQEGRRATVGTAEVRVEELA